MEWMESPGMEDKSHGVDVITWSKRKITLSGQNHLEWKINHMEWMESPGVEDKSHGVDGITWSGR